MRDSGIIATPARSRARGPPDSAPPRATSTAPAVARSAPKIARASSVRPAPTSPARATISPAWTVRLTPSTRGACRSRTVRTAGASAAATRLGGKAAVRERPSMAWMSESSVCSAAGAVCTTRPSRSTVTSSASASTSRRKCETSSTVRPAPASERTISCSCAVSSAPSGGRRLVHDDELGVARQRAQDLDLLLLGGRQPPGGRRGREVRGRRSRPAARSGGAAPGARRSRRRAARRPRKTFSSTVSCGTTLTSCAMVATPRSSASRGERSVTSSPSSSSRPASGASTPATIRPSVDLPAPFSPTSAWIDPRATLSDTASSARTAPKCLETSASSTWVRGWSPSPATLR